MERPNESQPKPRHITEWSDLPKKPEAVFGADGHVRSKYMKVYDLHTKDESKMDKEQVLKIEEHTTSCVKCKNQLHKLRRELPEGTLPF